MMFGSYGLVPDQITEQSEFRNPQSEMDGRVSEGHFVSSTIPGMDLGYGSTVIKRDARQPVAPLGFGCTESWEISNICGKKRGIWY